MICPFEQCSNLAFNRIVRHANFFLENLGGYLRLGSTGYECIDLIDHEYSLADGLNFVE